MNGQEYNPTNRKGQFLWMEPASRASYLQKLKKKIASGYYYSDNVITQVVDEIAPVIDDVAFSK